jgi:hypothetical protein
MHIGHGAEDKIRRRLSTATFLMLQEFSLQHPPDPAVAGDTNDGPRGDTLITAPAVCQLENQRF